MNYSIEIKNDGGLLILSIKNTKGSIWQKSLGHVSDLKNGFSKDIYLSEECIYKISNNL